jgi:hypothetical protein
MSPHTSTLYPLLEDVKNHPAKSVASSSIAPNTDVIREPTKYGVAEVLSKEGLSKVC